MTWSLYRWVWLVEAPLFVGAPPAGALNRCRPFVLSRGIWGGLTSELAQNSAGQEFPKYPENGNILRQDARFTYLYPAAELDGRWFAWLPRYESGRGLAWCPKEQVATTDAVPDRRFRRWLIDTRPGTAIDPDSDSAAEATLRETECVMARWRSGSPTAGDRIAFVGYAFLRDDLATSLAAITTLFLGGDTRYGLGRMERIEFERADTVFGAAAVLDGTDPMVVSSQLLGHGTTGRMLCGAKEALTGWDRTAANPLMRVGDAYWSPGSRSAEDLRWAIDEAGIWMESR